MQRIEKDYTLLGSNQSKKRKSTSDASYDTFPSSSKKVKKLRSSERVKNMMKAQTQTKSQSGRPIHRKYYADFYEMHPIKKLSTSIRPKPVKRKGPVTRASSHLKSVLATAKLAASRKLRMLKKDSQTPSRDYSRVSHVADMKKQSNGTPKRSPAAKSADEKSSSSANRGNYFIALTKSAAR